MRNNLKQIETLNEIGIALSAEKNHNRLLEKIVEGAMSLTNADGGSLYLIDDKHHLAFEILINHSLNLKIGSHTKKKLKTKSIALYTAKGKPNLNNVVSYCVNKNQTISVADVHHKNHFDFTGAMLFDKKFGYHSKSFLSIPLRNHEQKIIGVLQLINALDQKNTKIINFSKEKIHLAESLASQAAITLTQKNLIGAHKKLFEAFIQLIAKTIDEKSVYTSKHCIRVPIISMMIAHAAQKTKKGPLKDFCLTSDQMEELRIAAWLHDCGKIVTPEYVMDKSKKLETIMDRIELIKLRIEVLQRDLKITMLEKTLKGSKINEAIKKDYQNSIKKIKEAWTHIESMNSGGESLEDDDYKKIHNIAKQYYYSDSAGKKVPLLEKDELTNLCIARGTLNEKERKVIQNHVAVTLKMLNSLPYPNHLKHVPEIAASHHEHISGGGYPRGISGDQIPIQARIIAIADIFEALTAPDRPYKPAKKLSESLAIMANMKRQRHIDADIFDLFVSQKIYLKFAKKFLHPEQIDEVNEKKFLL